jgi:flagellar capping protein FliD
MMMLQHALARSEERMALSMQASLDALEARLGARFDALDSAVRVLQEEKKALQQRGST